MTSRLSPLSQAIGLSPCRGNPFINRTQTLTPWDWFRLCIFGPTLLPIRFAAMLVAFVTCAALCTVATFGVPLRDAGVVPLVKWRRAFLALNPFLMRMFVWGLGFPHVRTKGTPVGWDQAPFVVSNHVGVIEGAFLLSVYRASAVSALENTKVPILGRIIRGIECIVVDRAASGSHDGVFDAIKRRAKGEGGMRTQVVIFPEGTTTNQTSVITFKRGAFVAGTPVQPVACRMRWANMDPAWVNDGPSQYVVLLRLMAQVTNYLDVEYLPVYHPSPQEIADPDLYAHNVQQVIAKALGVPCTEYSFEDSWLGDHALRLRLHPSHCLLEWNSLRHVVRLAREQAKTLLQAFAAADTDRNCSLRWREFVGTFKPPAVGTEHVLRRWFDLLAVDGGVDFRNYCVGCAFLLQQTVAGNSDQSLDLLFDLLRDTSGASTVSHTTLNTILGAATVHAPLDHTTFVNFAATHIDALYTGLRAQLLPAAVTAIFMHEPHRREHAASAPAALTPPQAPNSKARHDK